MGIQNMIKREEELLVLIFNRLHNIKGIHILAPEQKHRLGVVSFYIENVHFNLGVKLLNDQFGIQVRGGCSCAGTYGHYLLEVDKNVSNILTAQISQGDLTNKPGWIRMSVHPTMTNEEVEYICDALESLVENHAEWSQDYKYDVRTNEFTHRYFEDSITEMVDGWFDL